MSFVSGLYHASWRASLSQAQRNAYRKLEHWATRATTAQPDSFQRAARYGHRVRDAVVHAAAALPRISTGHAATVTAAATFAYLGAASALPALWAVSPALLGTGLALVFGLETLRSHDAQLAMACVAGALVGAAALACLAVASAAWFAAGMLLMGALGAGLVALARHNALPKDIDVLPETPMPDSRPEPIQALPPEPITPAARTAPPRSPVCAPAEVLDAGPDVVCVPSAWSAASQASTRDPQPEVAGPVVAAEPTTSQAPATPVRVAAAAGTWTAALRDKAQALEGPHAEAYRTRIIDLIDKLEGPLAPTARRDVEQMLRQLESLAQTLTPAVRPEPSRQTQAAALGTALDKLPASDEVLTQTILDALGQLWGGKAENPRLVLSGANTCVETSIARAMSTHAGPALSFDLARKGLLSLVGCKPALQRPAPSELTTLMMAHPKTPCIVHIKDLACSSRDMQDKLLDLLDPTRVFVDDYFGLPINKDRLFLVVTAEGFADELATRNPPLWACLEAHHHTIRIKRG